MCVHNLIRCSKGDCFQCDRRDQIAGYALSGIVDKNTSVADAPARAEIAIALADALIARLDVDDTH
jgi:hypothetical protein